MSCSVCGQQHCACPRTMTVSVSEDCQQADFKKFVDAVNFCNDGDTITQCLCERCLNTIQSWIGREYVVIDKDLTLIGRRDV